LRKLLDSQGGSHMVTEIEATIGNSDASYYSFDLMMMKDSPIVEAKSNSLLREGALLTQLVSYYSCFCS
jgi:hypothetical protein